MENADFERLNQRGTEAEQPNFYDQFFDEARLALTTDIQYSIDLAKVYNFTKERTDRAAERRLARESKSD